MQPSSTPSSQVPLQKGLFQNGAWYCNCSPRLPAVQFTVRRDTPNKGRVFYTCQRKREDKAKCDFFLWSEDAHAAEMDSVSSNAHSEHVTPGPAPKRQRTLHESITPTPIQEKRQEKTPVTSIADLNRMLSGTDATSTTASSSTMKLGSPLSAKTNDNLDQLLSSDDEDELAHALQSALTQKMQSTPSASSKRKRPDVEEFSDFSAGEEDELAALADSSSQHKSKHQAVSYGTPTPGKTHTVENGMPTPLTEKPVRRVLFADAGAGSAKRPRTDDFTSIATSPLQGKQRSASPHSSPHSTPASSQEIGAGGKSPAANLTQEIMALLEGQKIDDNARRSVRGALDKHAARAKGLERGRDAARDAIKKAEARAASLQQRVADLENQRKLDAEARQKMRTDLMKLYRES
ncbi:hypothetical protein GGR54DRAFT_586383 [Hypoxylon sp. NC1633]|nr:hypothetical protein GGR54DRAFT_586383 [Hypoxylon sp. NC1633]